MPDDQTPHLGFPQPSPDNELEEDVIRLRGALRKADAEIAGLKAVAPLLSGDGQAMYAQLMDVLARVAQSELRMTRVELELIRLQGSGNSGPGGGSGGAPTTNPETGAYYGPVAAGASLLDMKDSGVFFLIEPGPAGGRDQDDGA